MFSGIIKNLGTISQIDHQGSNTVFNIKSSLAPELHIDQSLAHNGVCLTVEEINEDSYKVTAVKETLTKSNLGTLKPGDLINLERCITMQTLLDGHIVQGHVDATGTCIEKKEEQGSWLITFLYPEDFKNLIVEKGSICVNGVSLTAFNCANNQFSVAIIPYTFSHTNFSTMKPGDSVNIEFDIIGKYVQRSLIEQIPPIAPIL